MAVKEYLSCQEDDLKEIQEKINLIIQKGKDVIVWGTGAFTMNLLTTTNLGKCNIKCFVDNNSSKIDKMFFDKTQLKLPMFFIRIKMQMQLLLYARCCILIILLNK